MNVLIIADDEFVEREIPDCPADLVVSLGNLPDQTIIDIAQRCGARVILAVKGAHDPNAPFLPPIRNAHLTTFSFHGRTFGGFCGDWKYKPAGNFLFEQSEVQQHLTAFPAVNVFLAHNSPRRVHDRDDGVRVGFTAFNNYITRAKPKFFLHGHQHENCETLVGNTRVIGVFGHRFLIVPE